METIIKNLVEPHISEFNKNAKDWFKVTYTGLFKFKRVTITTLVEIGNMEPYTYIIGEASDEVTAWENAINKLDERLNGKTDWQAIDEIGDYLISLRKD